MFRLPRNRSCVFGFSLPVVLGIIGIFSVIAISPVYAHDIFESQDFSLVEAKNNVGKHVSLARHPESGKLYISYYDATKQELRLAKQVRSGGNCGPDNSWQCEVVDNGGAANNNVGMNSSLAFSPVSGQPGIAYHDTSNNGIKYADYFCNSGNCSWRITTVLSSPIPIDIYKYPSLKIGTDGMPRIAYYHQTFLNLNDSLSYAKKAGIGGNCGPNGSWQCDVVDSGRRMGRYPSLALTSQYNPLNSPYIAYYDGDAGDLKYAWYLGNGTSNCGGGDWNCHIIDASGNTGLYPSLSLGEYTNAKTGIAYFDAENERVKYAFWNDTAWPGNCGPGFATNWFCENVTRAASFGRWMSIDLDTYSNGVRALVASCPGCYGTGIYFAERGNGVPKCLPNSPWSCHVIKPTELLFDDISSFAELDISDTDKVAIAFYNATKGDVWVAQKNLLIKAMPWLMLLLD